MKRAARRHRVNNSKEFSNSLSRAAEQGGRTRRHKYARDLLAFVRPALITATAQITIYSLIFFRFNRSDVGNLSIVSIVLAVATLMTVTILTAFRRNESPIVSAVAVWTIIFSFAVTLLSAARVPVSYQGLAVVYPVAAAILAAANLKFNRMLGARAAVLDFSDAGAVAKMLPGSSVLADPDSSLDDIDYLLIDPTEHHNGRWSPLLTKAYLSNVDILPWMNFLEIRLRHTDVDSFDISHVVYTPTQFLYARLKRYIDIAGVIVTLPITVPLGVLVALYIWARDGGPVLFVQHRRGFAGRPFRMYKFRTMYRGKFRGATSSNDSRVIPGCRFIRRVRLDELPQLFNVLIGDMSLIGPRPESIDLAQWYEREIPEYVHRLLVLPGLTGWAQVNSGYTSNPDEAKVKLSYDLYYIKHLSFDLDVITLFRTIRTIVFGTGAR